MSAVRGTGARPARWKVRAAHPARAWRACTTRVSWNRRATSTRYQAESSSPRAARERGSAARSSRTPRPRAVEPVVDDGLDGAVGRTVGDVGQEHRRGGIEHAGGHQGPGGGGAPVELRLESPPRGQHREVGAVDAHGPPPQGRERQREDEDHDERDPERDDDVLPRAHAPSPAVVPGAVPAPTPRTRAARVRGSGRTRVAAVAMTVS